MTAELYALNKLDIWQSATRCTDALLDARCYPVWLLPKEEIANFPKRKNRRPGKCSQCGW